MGKAKRQARKHSNHHDNPKGARASVIRRQHSQNPKAQKKHVPKAPIQNPQQQRPRIPFTSQDQVLLVGEGDFTFSLSLKKNHKVGAIVATCFDTEEVLGTKYPSVDATLNAFQPIKNGIEPATKSPEQGEDGSDWEGFSPSPKDGRGEDAVDADDIDEDQSGSLDTRTFILYSIDATKLSTTHKKALKPYSPFTKIVFNFPHVGGISTDVNRQVRANQELLVGFFKAAKGLLSSAQHPAPQKIVRDDDDDDDLVMLESQGPAHGQILVTLFEGEPYTLWNIRDLARHCGLRVVESFKFPWSAYPGYRHARTIGDITTGKDRSEEGKRKGAWRGEERDARCYVLEDKDAPPPAPREGKRKRGDKDDESD